MSQGGYGYVNNSQLGQVAQADASTSHKIDILCLAILVLLLIIKVCWFLQLPHSL